VCEVSSGLERPNAVLLRLLHGVASGERRVDDKHSPRTKQIRVEHLEILHFPNQLLHTLLTQADCRFADHADVVRRAVEIDLEAG